MRNLMKTIWVQTVVAGAPWNCWGRRQGAHQELEPSNSSTVPIFFLVEFYRKQHRDKGVGI